MVYLEGVVQLGFFLKHTAHVEPAMFISQAPLPLRSLPLHSPLKLNKQKTTARTSNPSHRWITWVGAWDLPQTTHSASGVAPFL